MSGLPVDIATQLKFNAAVEKIELLEMVTRARTILSFRLDISNACGVTATYKSLPKRPQCYAWYSYGHVSKECPTETKARNHASNKTV